MTLMEVGETLTITASLSTTTFLALRSRTNSEVTIRVSPPGSCSSPVIAAKRTTPRAPSFKLSSPVTKPQRPATRLVHNNDSTTSTTQLLDKSLLQGWVMVSTLSYWSIAWVTATTSPNSRICVKLESEVDSKSPAPSNNFEEIDTIVELEPHDNVEDGSPIKFEIRTKANNNYKILTNSFMTVGMRDLMRNTAYPLNKTPITFNQYYIIVTQYSSAITPTPRTSPRNNKPATPTPAASNKGTLTRVNSPKPSIPSPSTTVNISTPTKSFLTRTNTPMPDFIATNRAHRATTIPSSATRKLQVRSSSFEAIPAPAVYKPAPRPTSISVYHQLQKTRDFPKPKDTRAALRLPAKHSKVSRPKINSSAVAIAASILTECATLRDCDEESDFSTWDSEDGASDFSELGENVSEWEKALHSCGLNPLALSEPVDSDFEIRDLCEMSKGLSPEINFTLGCPDDTSSCFSEDMSEIDRSILPECADDLSSDYFSSSDKSTMVSSVSSVGVFDTITDKNNKGLRGLQKLMTIRSKSEPGSPQDLKCKVGTWERKQMKHMEKEAKRAARRSKLTEKKEKKEEKHEKKKKEKETGTPKKPLSVRVKGCVKKFFGKGEPKEVEVL